MIYTLICRNQRILCDYDKGSGNYPHILHMAAQRETPAVKVSCPYPNSNYIFHLLRQQQYQLTFACMTDNQVSSGSAFAYLQQLKQKFHYRFKSNQIAQAINFEFQNQFIDTIKAVQSSHKNKTDSDKLKQINDKLTQAKDVVIATFDKLMNRADQLDLIVKRAHGLQDLSTQSRRDAATARSQAYWRNQKCKILGLGGVAGGILLIVLLIL